MAVLGDYGLSYQRVREIVEEVYPHGPRSALPERHVRAIVQAFVHPELYSDQVIEDLRHSYQVLEEHGYYREDLSPLRK